MSIERIAYSLTEAADACGLSARTLTRAIKANDLIAHYVGARLVIRASDLDAWIEAAPTERAS